MNISHWITIERIVSGSFVSRVLPCLAILGMTLSLYLVFCVVPGEAQMGAVQRLFYFHVGSAITAYAMVAALLVGSAIYLLTTDSNWDFFSQSAAGVAFLFCSLMLLTGMIWGHSSWNTWWRWEPRLVSSLILWLILAGYITVRNFAAGHVRQKNFLAVLGIIAACFVPIVVFSVRLMNQSEQLHPQVIGRQGLTDPTYRITLAIATLSLIATAFWFLLTALGNRLLEAELDRSERRLNQRTWDKKYGNA